MAKKKGGKTSAEAAAPKCSCTDPYKCACGNRPERPSKGHKWYPEEQIWAGKGHKQKGASGQTALVDQKAQVTSSGQTKIASWQRLPSQLLSDFAKRQKYARPKYKALETSPYKYHVILPDPKDSKKDLIFIPSAAVANEEQAKEEASLLALLHITPKIPHERTLPEPYRTTWLNAVTQQSSTTTATSNNNKSSNKSNKPSSLTTATATSSANSNNNHTSAAKASDHLLTGKVTSQAEKERRRLELQKVLNEHVRRCEALRMANRNPRVAMSAHMRKLLETLLRGGGGNNGLVVTDNDDDNDDLVESPGDTDVQIWVEQRLHDEGFTHRQARQAFVQTQQSKPGYESILQDQWESVVYEECLQWLLLHVDEDDLPTGFDPRGGHLEVVSTMGKDGNSAGLAPLVMNLSPEGQEFARRHGITPGEAALVFQKVEQSKNSDASLSPQDAFWQMIVEHKQLSFPESSSVGESSVERQTELEEETEALRAIFDEACHIQNDSKSLTTTITIQMEDGSRGQLEIRVRDGYYPSICPDRVLVSSSSWSNSKGTSLHGQIAEFLSTSLTLDQPAMFEIHGFVSGLLDTLDDLEPASLDDQCSSEQPSPKPILKPTTTTKPIATKSLSSTTSSMRSRSRRPREKSPFWSIPPLKTIPATAFPKLSPSLQRARASLPAANARKEFLDLLKKSQDSGKRVVLLTGETGCGKSTQIPQFILEEYPHDAKIVVCQPRRVAATGVATRVAEERGESTPGTESVGYVVRGDSAMCPKSRLVFCTTGVLLRQMQSENALDSLTHIVLDEVHERSLDMDILLALLKEKLPHHSNISVILMSATLDADKFASYWGRNTPQIHIPGRTFPVTDFFLEDVIYKSRYIPPKRKGEKKIKPADKEDKSEDEEETININGVSIGDLVARVDETSVDYKLLASLVKYIISSKQPTDDGSILVFLPGAPEINRALETVAKELSGFSLLLLPLHGGLQPREQRTVFAPAGAGKHKIIFSTNIAETSVTIPDCTAVIDCCREKQSSYDPSNRMPLLLETFCSKASLKQRRGRAGRVRSGTCYKLISKERFKKLKQDSEPEILRTALDQTLLSLLFLGIDCGVSSSFMGSLLDSPSTESLQSAMTSLETLGAVEKTHDCLTPLGMHIAGIPAPPVVGKILILGCILACRDAGLAMGAGMSIGRSPLLRIDTPRGGRGRRGEEEDDPEKQMEMMKQQNILKERKKLFDEVGKSDHAFLAKLFMEWEGRKGAGEQKKYCDKLGLSFPSMRDMLQLKQQYSAALSSLGYFDSEESNSHGTMWRIIRAVAVAGMAPSQLVKIVRPATKFQETAEGAKEQEGKAQALKFFVRTSRDGTLTDRENEERVFIHPSSGNFSTGNYSCPWLVYNSLVRTSKPFLRDVTECNEYSLLLFGGDLEIQASKGEILIDNWCRLSAGPKIGTLMGGLRKRLDELLSQKVSNPSFDIAATSEMIIISRLIRKDGF